MNDLVAEVEHLLRDIVARGGGGLYAQLLSPRAKRLRPRLVLQAGRLGPRPPYSTLVHAAAGLELLHEATLYHDDIVDEAPRRRGTPTAQLEFGPSAAALVGSELLYRTAECFAELPPILRRALARAVDAVCRGQLMELERIGDAELTVRERLRIMRDKTASLFAVAAHMGAALAGASEAVTRQAREFGRHFGLCFQLADDLMDLAGEPDVLGREGGADLLDGIYTLPVLLGLRKTGSLATQLREDLAALHHTRDRRRLRSVRALLEDIGALSEATATLDDWITDTSAAGAGLTALSEFVEALDGMKPARVKPGLLNPAAAAHA